MLKAFLNAFRVPDLRNKILFTLFIIAVYRFGAHVPVPVVDFGIIQRAIEDQGAGGFLQFINIFSGGALGRMAVFGLGIMPYITSSIIMQLLTVVIPKLQALQEQGEVGVKKINQYTRYVTVVLALLQSTGIVFLFHSGQSGIPDIFPAGTFTGPNVALIVLTLTAGTAMIMWLGELITQRGVGNGMSILIFTSVISSLPAEGTAILRQGGGFKFTVICLIGLGIIVAVVFMDQGQRRHPDPVRQTRGGSQDDRRRQHLPAAQGEPGRRDPDHLRDLGDVLPDAAGQRDPRDVVPGLREQVREQPDQHRLHDHPGAR